MVLANYSIADIRYEMGNLRLAHSELTGFTQTFDNWIQGLSRDFHGQQQQFSRIYSKARSPLPHLVAVCSSHKILYCHMILTFYKLITTMLVSTS